MSHLNKLLLLLCFNLYSYELEILASNIEGARSLSYDNKNNILYSGSKINGIYKIELDNSFKVKKVSHLFKDLLQTHGVAYYKDILYITDNKRIYQFKNNKKEILINNLPFIKKHHNMKDILVVDDKIYVAIGSPCNVCLEKDFGVILRYDLDGTNKIIYAKGIRNSVGLELIDNKLYFTDNGRDYLGDDLPYEELNIAEKEGLHFGFPYYHSDLNDPKFKKINLAYIKPIHNMQAHSAPLGLKYYDKTYFNNLKGSILIAQHGSWNRTKKSGYKIISLKYDKEEIVLDFLNNEKYTNRPVDIEILNNGYIVFSDDYNNKIYLVK